MEITKKILQDHFGQLWEYDHAVVLLERQPENKNHFEASEQWAKQQIKDIEYVMGFFSSKNDHTAVLESALVILEQLVNPNQTGRGKNDK